MGETGLAHNAPAHHAAGHPHPQIERFEFLVALIAVLCVQLPRHGAAAEVVGEGVAPGAQLVELLPALGDELVFVVVHYR